MLETLLAGCSASDLREAVGSYRARVLRDKGELAKAATLIRDRGYGGRYGELADAEEMLGRSR